jgi:hypothetical protein
MPEWIYGYGSYGSNAEITMNCGGPIRRIVAGFYTDRPAGVTGPPVVLTPHVNNGIDNDVMIYTNHSVKIQKAAGLTNAIIFLLVEFELEYPSKNPITP